MIEPDPPAAPAYEHDCSNCIFLGQSQADLWVPRVNAVDMYVHPHPGGSSTFILRYSSHGSDYTSISAEIVHALSTSKYHEVIAAAKKARLL